MVEDGCINAGLPERGLGQVVPYEQKTLLSERILKSDIGALPIWLGQRVLDNYDREKFDEQLSWGAQFGCYDLFKLSEAHKLEGLEPYPALAGLDYDLRKVLTGINRPLAIFIITTKEVAEYPWVLAMANGLKEVRLQANKPKTLVYKIMMGGFEFKQEGPEDPGGHFSKKGMRAHELGGVILPYDTDTPTPSTKRLVEFMNRLMGADLPGPEFPDYSDEEIRKMAWHIGKESFNSFYKKTGAIPKYPIENGRPVFAF